MVNIVKELDGMEKVKYIITMDNYYLKVHIVMDLRMEL